MEERELGYVSSRPDPTSSHVLGYLNIQCLPHGQLTGRFSFPLTLLRIGFVDWAEIVQPLGSR